MRSAAIRLSARTFCVMVLSIAAPLLKSSDCFNCHAGGQIELRLDQPDGELLATADIESTVNGSSGTIAMSNWWGLMDDMT